MPKIRAEELEISVPDGRSVNILVNCTPILSAEDEPKSLVITIQDLAPLRELERQRADFLSMVSHELRTPLSAIKGSTMVLLNQDSPPDAAEVGEYHRLIDDQTDHMRTLITDLLDTGRDRSRNPDDIARNRNRVRNTGTGQGRVRSWRRTLSGHRPAAGFAAGDGREATHCPSVEQSAFQFRPTLAGFHFHPHQRQSRRAIRHHFSCG